MKRRKILKGLACAAIAPALQRGIPIPSAPVVRELDGVTLLRFSVEEYCKVYRVPPRLVLHPEIAARLGLKEGDPAHGGEVIFSTEVDYEPGDR